MVAQIVTTGDWTERLVILHADTY